LSSNAPILFHNGIIHTVDDRRPSATWFTTYGRRFQRVGSGEPPSIAKKVDLRGRVVVPGFVDAHAHFFQTGIDALHVDLSSVRTLAELEGALKDQAPRGQRTWVFANSFEEDSLHDVELLTRHHLDAVFAERPVWVNRVDYHSAVVNTAALKRLEIPAETPGLVKGKGGDPLGVLRAEAYFHAKVRVSRYYSIETKDKAVKAAVQACLPKGITAVHALEGGEIFGDEGVHAVLRKMGSVPIDLTLFLQEKNVYLTSQMGFEHLGGCILIDGSIGSYTAALDHDYEGLPGTRGVLYEKSRALASFVDKAHRRGAQLAFHAIGPRAIQMVLDAYAKALDRTPRFDHRHRIEHFEMATDAQIAQAAELGVVASMQPAFEYYWGGPNGMYASRLGEGWRKTNRLRSILDAGVVIAGGSDTNVTPPDPLLGMHAAVNHPNPDERIDAARALRMMTRDAAYGGFTESRHGSITAGKEANFVFLDADPMAVAPEKIKDVRVLETWIHGRPVWRREDDPDHGDERRERYAPEV
jgi:predicted amidohydrolase YtcJ